VSNDYTSPNSDSKRPSINQYCLMRLKIDLRSLLTQPQLGLYNGTTLILTLTNHHETFKKMFDAVEIRTWKT